MRSTYFPVAGCITDLPASIVWRTRIGSGSTCPALLFGRSSKGGSGKSKSCNDELHGCGIKSKTCKNRRLLVVILGIVDVSC
jgi:hypothetical protein